MNQKLKNYSDRELLEIIISNQVTTAQIIFRMNDFFLDYYGEDYIEKINHKDATFSKLLSDHKEVIRQLKENN